MSKIRNVLVLEDDPAIWRALERWLRAQNYQPYWASKVHQALDFLITDPIDLVLLDVELDGGFGGLTIIPRLDPKRTKCIILSGHTSERVKEEIANFSLSRVSAILGKPLDLSTLGETIEEVLDPQWRIDTQS